jgi:predicted porin
MILLGTTALVGVGAAGVAVPDVADAAQVLPGGALDVTISGFAYSQVHGGDLDRQRNDPAVSTGLDFSNDTEVHVILRGRYEAFGLDYGGMVEFEADTNRTDNTDETWVFVRGGFGELRFGDEDGAADASSIGAYTIAAGTGGIDGAVVDALAISPVRPSSSNDATTIRYYTPSFGGFQVGVSYTPNVNSGAGNGDTLAFKDVQAGDLVEGALVYKGDFARLGIQASLVGSYGDVKGEDALGGDEFWTYYVGVAADVFGFKCPTCSASRWPAASATRRSAASSGPTSTPASP